MTRLSKGFYIWLFAWDLPHCWVGSWGGGFVAAMKNVGPGVLSLGLSSLSMNLSRRYYQNMTQKYNAYIALLAARDSMVALLAALALGTVISWELLTNRKTTPFNASQTKLARVVLLAGGLALYILTLIILASIPIE